MCTPRLLNPRILLSVLSLEGTLNLLSMPSPLSMLNRVIMLNLLSMLSLVGMLSLLNILSLVSMLCLVSMLRLVSKLVLLGPVGKLRQLIVLSELTPVEEPRLLIVLSELTPVEEPRLLSWLRLSKLRWLSLLSLLSKLRRPSLLSLINQQRLSLLYLANQLRLLNHLNLLSRLNHLNLANYWRLPLQLDVGNRPRLVRQLHPFGQLRLLHHPSLRSMWIGWSPLNLVRELSLSLPSCLSLLSEHRGRGWLRRLSRSQLLGPLGAPNLCGPTLREQIPAEVSTARRLMGRSIGLLHGLHVTADLRLGVSAR